MHRSTCCHSLDTPQSLQGLEGVRVALNVQVDDLVPSKAFGQREQSVKPSQWGTVLNTPSGHDTRLFLRRPRSQGPPPPQAPGTSPRPALLIQLKFLCPRPLQPNKEVDIAVFSTSSMIYPAIVYIARVDGEERMATVGTAE
jgi:hypothetical protein